MSIYKSLASQLRRGRSDESGNLIITAALLLPVVVGSVGAAIVYSNANASRTSLQSALDAAVLSGAIAIGTGQDPVTAAQNMFNNDVNSHATQTNTSKIAATFSVNGDVVSGQASGNAANPFAGLIGSQTIALNVSAAAKQATIPVCVLALNSLDKGSFDVNGSPQFNADCAVQANTTSSSGMTQEGKAPVKAAKFGVTGGANVNNYSPPPAPGTSAITDPYASLPFPSYDSCASAKGNAGTDIKTDTTLSPGTYCGGLHIYATAHVTLQPGIYVMNGGPFLTDGSAVVTGDQVMIAFTGKGSTLQIWGNSQVSVTSPISGTYMNMQFMQDNSSTDTHALWVSIGGSDSDTGKLSYDGVAYFPTQNFWVRGSSTVNANSPTQSIVAAEVWDQGHAIINVTHNNTRNLNVSGPTTGFGARLIN